MASFASETAHELKTPLTSMMMIGEIALREPNNTADLRDSLGTILEECQHMDQLIEGILLIAQAKSKRLAVAITHVDLNALAAECVERLKPIAEASDQSLELRVPPRQIKQPALTVACDRALLRQAAINLISNAIVHNASGTQISITAESTDKGPRLIVCDNGVGFNPHAEKQIFKLESAAYRSEKKDDMRRHLGLGLSIATSLVESQGAQLTIDRRMTKQPEYRLSRRPSTTEYLRKLTTAAAVSLALASGEAFGFELGAIELQSAINQPLSAEIALTSVKSDNLQDIRVTLASAEAFARAGISDSLLMKAQALRLSKLRGHSLLPALF